MRRLFTVLALSGLFAATPALARKQVARDASKSGAVAEGSKPAPTEEAKPASDGTKPAEKPVKKGKRKTKTTESSAPSEKPVEGTPAK